nr:hypothetical protein [Tanacetum cinerariifolium]
EFEARMHEKFQMSAMGDILKKFGYSEVRSSNTLMDKENPWGKDETGKDVDLHLYISMIGSLMYLTTSRPDIMFAVCACASNTIMARLQFCDYHNMVAILEKSEHNFDFHSMVDFIEASPLRTVTESSLRRNLKLKDEEGIKQLEREDQRMSEQIARDAEIARIHAKEELQIMIDGLERNNETIAKYLQEYHQFASELHIVKDFRGMTFKEVEAKFNSVWKQIEDFIPIGSKEEAEIIKRKGLSLEQESAKKFKPSEEVTEEAKSPNKVPKEKIKEMMQQVPIKEVYVEALQVKHPIIDWKVHSEDQRAYWKITRLKGSSASYQFFIDLLKHLDREDLNQL